MNVVELIERLRAIPDQTLPVVFDMEWAYASVDNVVAPVSPYADNPVPTQVVLS